MLDLMYELPSQTSVKDFTVTRAMVEEHTGGKVLPYRCNTRTPAMHRYLLHQ